MYLKSICEALVVLPDAAEEAREKAEDEEGEEEVLGESSEEKDSDGDDDEDDGEEEEGRGEEGSSDAEEEEEEWCRRRGDQLTHSFLWGCQTGAQRGPPLRPSHPPFPPGCLSPPPPPSSAAFPCLPPQPCPHAHTSAPPAALPHLGFDAGVTGMRVGDKRKLVIPPQMGYGKKGAPPDIPPNAVLEFEIELVDVRDKKK